MSVKNIYYQRRNDQQRAVANQDAQQLHQNFEQLEIVNDAQNVGVQQERPENYNWQISKQTLKERFEYLFNNQVLADIYFIVGSEQLRIPAHKLGKNFIS